MILFSNFSLVLVSIETTYQTLDTSKFVNLNTLTTLYIFKKKKNT